MIRGLYSAASGISAQAARTDIYAANLANTPPPATCAIASAR